MKGGAFSDYHPLVNFIFFALVIICAMFFLHPLALAVGLLCSFTYSLYLGGKKSLRFNLLYLLPLMLFAALLNPAFNHRGVTILRYFPNGNPLTLESICFGLAAVVMLVTVICWFSCYNYVMSSDKFIRPDYSRPVFDFINGTAFSAAFLLSGAANCRRAKGFGAGYRCRRFAVPHKKRAKNRFCFNIHILGRSH